MFSSEKIAFYVEKMAGLGYDKGAVLIGTGVSEAVLSQEKFRISSEQYGNVVANMITLSGCPDLGIDIGLSLRPRDYGLLGYAMITAKDFGRMMAIWEMYNQSLYGAAIQVHVKLFRGVSHLIVNVMQPPGLAYRFCMEEFIVSCQYFLKNLSESQRGFCDVYLKYARPKSAIRLEELVNCPIYYEASENILICRGNILLEPVRTVNEELNIYYSSLCEKLAGKVQGSTPLVERIKSAFISRPDNLPTMTEIADSFHCSERNLRRKLLDAGYTYRGLLNEFRCAYAKEYLTTTRLSNKEIAFALGYHDDKAFIKAFKLQVGLTPQRFRENTVDK